MSNIIWIIVIGFVAGTSPNSFLPDPMNRLVFVITTLLGIGGAFVATL